jgi:ABC-type branched-subunit amino acid transport system substrate-binding protein
VVAPLVGIALLAAACGGDDDDASSSATTAPAGASETTAAPADSTPATTAATGSTATGSTAPDATTGGTGGSGTDDGLDNAGGGPLADEAATATFTGAEGSGLTRGVSDDSIKLGCVYTNSSYAGFDTGLKARIERTNRDGGVAGRKIELLPCVDDGADVSANVAAVQQIVDQDQAFAVFSLSNVILNGSNDYLNENEVPYYGWGFNPGFCGTRWGFGWNGCLGGNAFDSSMVAHAAISGNLADAVITGLKMKPEDVRIAIQVQNSAAGEVGLAQFKAIYEDRGAQVVFAEKTYPENAAGADVTPYAQAIIDAKPNIVLMTIPFPEVPRLVAGLRAGGYDGAIVDFQNYVPGLLESSPQLATTLAGEYVNTQIVPSEEGTPWVKQEQSDLQAIGEQPFVTLAGAIGYAEAELLIEQLEAVGDKLDTATFDSTVNGGSFTAFTGIDGGPGPLQWPAAHLLPADCAAVVRINGTSYDVVSPFQCYSSLKVF